MDFGCVPRLVSLSLVLVFSASAEGQNITATVGQEVILPCQARNYRPFEVVEWSRPEKNTEYVLVFDQTTSDLEIPEQNYKGRVGLVDMEDGDVSLKLSNVTYEDGGTYECYVVRGANRKRRAIQPINTVYLKVLPPPPGRGHIGLVAGLMICALVILAAVPVLKKRESFHSLSPHDEAEKPQNVDISRTFHWSSLCSHHSNPAIRKPMRTFRPDAGPKPGQMERVV